MSRAGNNDQAGNDHDRTKNALQRKRLVKKKYGKKHDNDECQAHERISIVEIKTRHGGHPGQGRKKGRKETGHNPWIQELLEEKEYLINTSFRHAARLPHLPL